MAADLVPLDVDGAGPPAADGVPGGPVLRRSRRLLRVTPPPPAMMSSSESLIAYRFQYQPAELAAAVPVCCRRDVANRHTE